MMKKLLFTLLMLAGASVVLAQNTYYWVGGSTATSLTEETWSLAPNGEAVSRNNSGDILIFDNVTVELNITGVSFGKLQLQNNADVTFERKSPTNTGGTTVTLNGSLGQGLSVNNSKLRLNSSTDYNMTILLPANVTGIIDNSEMYIVGTGTGQTRIVTTSIGALGFDNGSLCFVNSSSSPFGNTGGSNNLSVDRAVVFSSGTSLVYQGGSNPFGSNAAGHILDLKPGSNFVFEANNVSNMFNSKIYGNLTVKSDKTVALTESFYNIDNLTIENGGTFNMRNTGVSPISGNVVNNGTFGVNGAIGSANLLFTGNSPQTISGTGTFNNLGAITVGADAAVKLETSLNILGEAQSSVLGLLDFDLYEIRGIGTAANRGRFQFRGAVAGNTTNQASISTGNHVVTISTSEEYSSLNPVVGLLVTGSQIPANTYIIATSSSNRQITLSKAPTGNGTTLIVSSQSPTFKTANIGGVDGSVFINENGTLSFAAGTNYIFGATSTPFSEFSNSSVGNVTLNNFTVLNKDVSISGKLKFNTAGALLKIPLGKVLTMLPSSSFERMFDLYNSNYIVTSSKHATGEKGKIIIQGVDASTTKLIPIGTESRYMPISLTPNSLSSFEIFVFTHVTKDGEVSLNFIDDEEIRSNLVNAVWNVKRINGSGNCTVSLGWDNDHEGVNFIPLSDSEIGIAGFINGAYSNFTGSGNNTLNTATAEFIELGPLVVGKSNTTLPVKLLSFTANAALNSVKLSWKTTSEKGLAKYIIQNAQNDLNGFKNIYSVAAHNLDGTFDYSYVDFNPIPGDNYYRLISEDLDGTQYISDIKSVKIKGSYLVNAYPNPVLNSFNISGLTTGDIIKVSDLKGTLIIYKIYNENSISEIDLERFNAGIYLLSIENAGKITATKRLIKL